jgi:hypothetical protein
MGAKVGLFREMWRRVIFFKFFSKESVLIFNDLGFQIDFFWL